MLVHSNKSSAIDASKLIDVIVLGARIGQICFVDHELVLGGAMSLPDNLVFYVRASNLHLLGQNFTAVE